MSNKLEKWKNITSCFTKNTQNSCQKSITNKDETYIHYMFVFNMLVLMVCISDGKLYYPILNPIFYLPILYIFYILYCLSISYNNLYFGLTYTIFHHIFSFIVHPITNLYNIACETGKDEPPQSDFAPHRADILSNVPLD